MIKDHVIPSDDLLRLRELALNWPPLFRLLEMAPQLKLVIDTNVVIRELIYAVKWRKNPSARSNLQEAIDSGVVVALAPPKLQEEVLRHIPRLAEEEGVSEDELRQAWLEYRPRINFIDVGEASAEEVAAAVDPDDLPFVRLCQSVNADAVVSGDRHIHAMGSRSVRQEALRDARDYARGKAPEVTLRIGVYAITFPAAAGAYALVSLLKSVAKRVAGLPLGFQLALLGVAVGVGAHPRSRRALLALISSRASGLKEPTLTLLDVMGDLAERWADARRQVELRQGRLERSIPQVKRRPLRLVARSVCLEAGRALTTEEIARAVVRAGYESDSGRFKYYLVRVMHQSGQFMRTPDGRWAAREDDKVVSVTKSNCYLQKGVDGN